MTRTSCGCGGKDVLFVARRTRRDVLLPMSLIGDDAVCARRRCG